MKLYLDIETTSLSKHYGYVTVVGAYDGKDITQLVRGIDLNPENLAKLFNNKETIVSFNGIRFDVPFLQHHFPHSIPLIKHKDLMYLGWKLGFWGGLKSIEERLGVKRRSGINNGAEAVKLWHVYRGGDDSSLDKLLEYNREDVLNLEIVEEVMEDLAGKASLQTQR